MSTVIEQFKNREVKGKEVFEIVPIHKTDAYDFIVQYHYLGKAKFFSIYNYGMFIKGTNILVGVATYSNPQGPNSLRGWFNVPNSDQTIVELSRLCVLPELNGSNASSFLLSNSIKKLKPLGIRAVITLADSSRHSGSIYQVCNFKYYGLTPERAIFYTNTNKKNPRIIGKKDIQGVWVPMSRKHRYAFLLDPSLKVLHTEEPYPKKIHASNICVGCNDTMIVKDTRFDVYYTCPMCCTKLVSLDDVERDIITNSNSENKREVVDSIISKKVQKICTVELW